MGKNILYIAWDGKLGDSILSSNFIQYISQAENSSIITITTPNLASLYKDYGCKSVFIINSNCELEKKDIIRKIINKHKIDTTIYLNGRVSINDFNILKQIEGNTIYSLDPSLNKESQELYVYHIDKPFKKIFDYLYFIITEKKNSLKSKVGSLSPILINGDSFVIFNPFGSREDKSLSMSKCIEILNLLSDRFPNTNFKVLNHISNMDIVSRLIKNINKHNVIPAEQCKTIHELFYLLSASCKIISVDTSIIHIAKALDKPLLAIYPKFDQFNVWEPIIDDRTKIIYSIQEEDYSGFGMKNMNNIDLGEIRKYFLESQKTSPVRLVGKITHNLNVAHKNIAMQKPYFVKDYPELAHCYNGTINLVFEKKFRLEKPSFSIKDLYWTESKRKKESFDFFRISLFIHDQIIPAWIYSPSNSPHKTNFYFKEVITEKLDLYNLEEITIELPDERNIIFIE